MKTTKPDFVLAFALNAKGIAFVLFEGQLTPHDWRVSECRGRGRHNRMYERAAELIEGYRPDIVVLEAYAEGDRRRPLATRKTSLRIEHAAHMAGCGVARYSRVDVKQVFADFGAKTKPKIAAAIAAAIPAFSHKLPPARKIWMSEDGRQLLFDAAALGLATYLREL